MEMGGGKQLKAAMTIRAPTKLGGRHAVMGMRNPWQ
jgi:hypothetical protein